MVEPTRIEDALTHLKDLFLEAPRLSFSTEQASRLTGIDEETCLLLLLALLDRRFLERARHGAFVLRVDERVPEV